MKQSKKKKIKARGVQIACWVLAGLMIIGTVAMVVSAIIAMF